MPVKIQGSYGGQVEVDREPDQCPICHKNLFPTALHIENGGRTYRADITVVYRCPSYECQEIFVAYFRREEDPNEPTPRGRIFSLISTRPAEPSPITLAQCVQDISQTFCEIYNEAHRAEQFGLTQICGVGYRKALEFLIKDYLIKERPHDKASIESAQLGPCINNYVADPKTKEVAKRATWLGNDETHYQRRWIGKDLNDLKTLISLVMHWIEAEHLTAEALKSMP